MNTKKDPQKKALRTASAAVLGALLLCAAAALGQDVSDCNSSAAESESDMLFMLLQIQADVQGSLNDLDFDVADAAQNLSATGLEGDAARDVLRRLLKTNSNLAEALIFNRDGKIISVEYSESEGANEGNQDIISLHSAEKISHPAIELIDHVLKTKTPAFSKVFQTLEGLNGSGLGYPVLSPQGELLGGIGITVEPDKLLNALVAPQLHFDTSTRGNITDYSFWMLHLDGLVAYDRDESQIGKNLFEDPLYRPYPSLLDLGHRIVAERAGHGNYSFQVTEGDKKVVTKDAYWTTAGIHGREWRLVVTKIMP